MQQNSPVVIEFLGSIIDTAESSPVHNLKSFGPKMLGLKPFFVEAPDLADIFL